MESWKIKNLAFSIDNKDEIIRQFSIINCSSLFLQKDINCKSEKYSNISNAIEKYSNYTGIMVDIQTISSDMKIYIFTFDINILFLESSNISHFHEYFSKNKDKLLFISQNSQKEFLHYISNKTELSNTQETSSYTTEPDFYDIIINNIIKKSQYLSILRRKNFKQDINLYYFISIHTFTSLGKKSTYLCYNYKDHHLYVMKTFTNSDLNYNHEVDFYKKIGNNFPFISRIFGTFKNYGKYYIITEYIEGDTLKNFVIKNKIDYTNKIAIILNMLLTVEYIHSNGICLRDLKWDNIIIDSKLNPIFIDFDSTTQNISESTENDLTDNIGSMLFAAPEQNETNNYSFKVDVYSLGVLIHFILTEQTFDKINLNYISNLMSSKENILKKKEITKCPKNIEHFFDIYKDCCNYLPESRPSINQIINNFLFHIQQNELHSSNSNYFLSFLLFYINFHFNFLHIFCYDYERNEDYLKDKSELFYFFGEFYYNGEFIPVDMGKSIKYLIQSSNYQNSKALCQLGCIYSFHINMQRNINESIHYFTLSANLNNSIAQYFLGFIFYFGYLIEKDIQKAIKYFKLASDQGHSDAQYNLGFIYYDGSDVEKDIKKSIYYLELSSKNDNSNANYLLGEIYLTYKNVEKAIEYLKMASDIYDPRANLMLGIIYHEGILVQKDNIMALYFLEKNIFEVPDKLESINNKISVFKVPFPINNHFIKYFSFLDNSTFIESFYYLGEIYYECKYIEQSLNCLEYISQFHHGPSYYLLGKIYLSQNLGSKALHYLTLASNQNIPGAFYLLGYMYLNGIYVNKNVTKAIKYFLHGANNNNSECQFLIGKYYFDGTYLPKNISKSIYYLKLASDNNNANAQDFFGDIYFNGFDVEKNISLAIDYYEKSAINNNSIAQYNIGKLYLEGKYVTRDINKGIKFLIQSANQNFSMAQMYLGMHYYEGDIVNQDINKGLNYLTLASQQNDEKAYYLLGYIYFEGIYVLKNIPKAIQFLTIASTLNQKDAQYLLGLIYFNGYEVQVDAKKGISFLELAANSDHSVAQCCLGEVYYYGLKTQKNIEKSMKYFRLSAKNNDMAQYHLGQIYMSGVYFKKDIEKAIYYLEKSSNNKNVQAQYLLSLIYYVPLYGKNDINKTLYYLSLASDQFHPYANYLLGIFYKHGVGVSRNINKAILYFTRSSDFNIAEAKYELGYIYTFGEVPCDIDKAMKYLKKSSNLGYPSAHFLLGIFYFDCKLIPVDMDKAIHYITLASKKIQYALLILGYIYYSGINIPQDIHKAIYYFKESSSFNNHCAKNNLGVIYKNGKGIVKNIINAIIYFEEAIKLSNDKYALYNLSRIYYFGIDIDKNIQKAIDLLEIANKESFFQGELFLYFIYCNTNDEDKLLYMDSKYKSIHKFLESLKLLFLIYFNDVDVDFIIKSRLKQFFYEYDLVYSVVSDFETKFSDFMINGSFYNQDDSKFKNNFQCKEIDHFFYEGFGET